MATVAEVKEVLWAVEQLKPISRKLNGIGVRACNGYHSESQEKRDNTTEAKLIAEGQRISAEIGLRFYHQTDPRGCAVYLIDDTMDDSTYNLGIAIA